MVCARFSSIMTEIIFLSYYRPEIDITDGLGPELLSQYLHIVGILRWAIELVRIDIFNETFMLSQYQDTPRVGHLDDLDDIFSYLKSHMNMWRIDYDPMDLNVNF